MIRLASAVVSPHATRTDVPSLHLFVALVVAPYVLALLVVAFLEQTLRAFYMVSMLPVIAPLIYGRFVARTGGRLARARLAALTALAFVLVAVVAAVGAFGLFGYYGLLYTTSEDFIGTTRSLLREPAWITVLALAFFHSMLTLGLLGRRPRA